MFLIHLVGREMSKIKNIFYFMRTISKKKTFRKFTTHYKIILSIVIIKCIYDES